MSTLQITLPDELQQWLEARARGNGTTDASEFVVVLLHQAKAQDEVQSAQLTDEEMLGGRTEAEVAALLNEGLAGESMPFTPELWADILDEADESARQKGLKSNLRESFLAEGLRAESQIADAQWWKDLRSELTARLEGSRESSAASNICQTPSVVPTSPPS